MGPVQLVDFVSEMSGPARDLPVARQQESSNEAVEAMKRLHFGHALGDAARIILQMHRMYPSFSLVFTDIGAKRARTCAPVAGAVLGAQPCAAEALVPPSTPASSLPSQRQHDSNVPGELSDDELDAILDEQCDLEGSWAAARVFPHAPPNPLSAGPALQSSCSVPGSMQATQALGAAAEPASEAQDSCPGGAAQYTQLSPLPPLPLLSSQPVPPQPVPPHPDQKLPIPADGDDADYGTDDENDDRRFVGPEGFTQATQDDELPAASAPLSHHHAGSASANSTGAATTATLAVDEFSDGIFMDLTLGTQTIRSRVRNARKGTSPVATTAAATGSLLSVPIEQLMSQARKHPHLPHLDEAILSLSCDAFLAANSPTVHRHVADLPISRFPACMEALAHV